MGGRSNVRATFASDEASDTMWHLYMAPTKSPIHKRNPIIQPANYFAVYHVILCNTAFGWSIGYCLLTQCGSKVWQAFEYLEVKRSTRADQMEYSSSIDGLNPAATISKSLCKRAQYCCCLKYLVITGGITQCTSFGVPGLRLYLDNTIRMSA